MLGCDRISEGWQVWLTPRQKRIIYDAPSRNEAEVETQAKRVTER